MRRLGVDSVDWSLAHAVLCQPERDAIATLDSALFGGVINRANLTGILTQLPQKYAAYDNLLEPEAESG